jgi:membrane dipeptidase
LFAASESVNFLKTIKFSVLMFPLIFDAHLDLSMNAMEWNRDLTSPLGEIREREKGLNDKPDRCNGTVSFPEMRKGNIGICMGTNTRTIGVV